MQNKLKVFFSFILCVSIILSYGSLIFASSPTDEILNYEITADVNSDASVNIHYYIQWKVLETAGIGNLSWITVGLPTSYIRDIYTDCKNVRSIYMDDGEFATIEFDREYGKNEVVTFDFTVCCDYLYKNNEQSGTAAYFFKPGWFDGIAIDRLYIRWNKDKATMWSADGGSGTVIDGNYITCEWKNLSPGVTGSIEILYPNDAFGFETFDPGFEYNPGYEYHDTGFGALFSVIPVLFFVFITLAIKMASNKAYDSDSGFCDEKTQTKVTHTKVVYFDKCPGCGAPREEGAEVCPYCDRSMIKSEEIIKEEETPEEDKDALKFKKKGVYHYSSDPNTFVRVNTIHVPIITTGSSGRSGGVRTSASSRTAGRGGGCAHSSCACVSCACACACACAGGGRAGCSTKDFYDTKIKLKQIERTNKKKSYTNREVK